ncbi:MAG: helix-turn-helix domain-containing protein [Anaerolineae bacterium]
MIDQHQPQDEFVIKDLEAVKFVADPLRLQIMRELKQPGTVKGVAAALGKPATKLYYHVNLLEKHGFIRVVDTNIVSGIIEKRYQITAHRYRVDESLLSGTDVTDAQVGALLSTIFDVAKTEIKRSIAAGLMDLSQEPSRRHDLLWHTSCTLTKAQVAELYEQLESMLKQFESYATTDTAPPDARPYGLTVAFYPISRPPDGDSPDDD